MDTSVALSLLDLPREVLRLCITCPRACANIRAVCKETSTMTGNFTVRLSAWVGDVPADCVNIGTLTAARSQHNVNLLVDGVIAFTHGHVFVEKRIMYNYALCARLAGIPEITWCLSRSPIKIADISKKIKTASRIEVGGQLHAVLVSPEDAIAGACDIPLLYDDLLW